jgi:hypothetical protein
VLGVVGRRTGAVLAKLGVYGPGGDPREAPPFTQATVGGHEVLWLLEQPTAALAIADAAHAGDVWQTVEHAGRAQRIHCVGLDALGRYVVAERLARRSAGLL